MSATTVKFGDFNGDNLIDFVEGSSESSIPLKVHLNTGDSLNPNFDTFYIITNTGISGYVWDIEVYDLNGDGNDDIITADFGASQVFISNGDGTFNDKTIQYFPDPALRNSWFAKSLTIADVNQDGIIDIYFSRDNQDLLFYGQGTPLSVSEFTIPNNALQLNVYPNPVQKALTVSFVLPKEEEVSLIIYNILGQEIHRKEFTGLKRENTKEIDLRNIANGIYFLQLNQGKNTDIIKIIKVK